MAVIYTSILFTLFYSTSFAAPQQPEINDQFKTTDQISEKAEPAQPVLQTVNNQTQSGLKAKPATETIDEISLETEDKDNTAVAATQVSFTLKVYKFIADPIYKVVNTPKVNEVLRNIGTCVVNGAMELFSYYLPAPFMPLLASAAGLVIPFEPVVMLKERMPVTSYRRAFQTAMSTFLRTFDKYKVADEFDPYMTRRFNRRFMDDNDNLNKKEAERTPEPAVIEE